MRQQDEKTKHSRKSKQAPAAVSVSEPFKKANTSEHQRTQHRSRHIPMPKQIMDGCEIRSRFDQISGKGLPKRMTTGKFVYLGPTDRLPDSPI